MHYNRVVIMRLHSRAAVSEISLCMPEEDIHAYRGK